MKVLLVSLMALSIGCGVADGPLYHCDMYAQCPHEETHRVDCIYGDSPDDIEGKQEEWLHLYCFDDCICRVECQ